MAAYLDALQNPEYIEIEITQAVKQADMGLIPQPFSPEDGMVDRTVVLLDPVSPLMAKLLALHEAGESINTLLHEGYLRVDNAALSRATPPGVMAAAGKWRNSA